MSQVQRKNRSQDTSAPDGRASESDGFDFTRHMRRLCDDMVTRVESLRHIRMDQVALGFTQARKATRHGMFASLTAMRFAEGRMDTIRHGKKWGIQRLFGRDGREKLYILSFYLPRYLDLSFREKLVTVVHELWHIGPKFDGDLRRFNGRCYAHGTSKDRYEAQVEKLTDQWLAADPPAAVHDFLRYDSRQLLDRHGRIFGMKVRVPKVIRLA